MKSNKLIAILLISLILNISFLSSVYADNAANLSDVSSNEKQSEISFPQVSLEEIKSEMEKAISGGHPYIIANKNNINRVKEYAFGKDKILTAQYTQLKSKADTLVKSGIIKINVDTSKSSYIGSAIDAWNNTMILALAYHVENDESYAKKAYEQSEYFCSLNTWGTYQMIDNVQTAFCVAICYDWLYDWLDADQKEVLVNGLRKLHLNTASDVFKNRTKEEYKWSFHQAFFGKDNHAIMDCSLTFLSAMAIAETDIDFMSDVMQLTLKQLENPFSNWYPDSGWYEGVGYWGYAGPYTTRLFLSMQSAFGHCFGYDEIDCLMNLADFPIYASSDNGAFVLADMYLSTGKNLSPIYYSMAKLKGDLGLQSFAIKECNVDTVPDAVFALTYDPLQDYTQNPDFSLDKLFRNIDMVTMRNTFEGNQSTWCGMGVIPIRPSGMMNVGSIGFDALGERWIMNHGKENYYKGYFDMEGGRWQYYRTRAEAQSCIVINPSEFGGQNIDARDNIDSFVSGAGSSYAIADLSETYLGQVNSYKRGIMLANGRKTFVVQDEIDMPDKSEVYSFFNIFDSDIVINDDGKTAILSKGNKKVYVKVDCDKDFTFAIMPCEPLPTSPVPENPNSPNDDFKKLYLHFESEDKINVRVSFTPYLCDSEIENISVSNFVPMSQWCVENEIKDVPTLTNINVNNKPISDFNPYDRCYEVSDIGYPANLTVNADTDLYDIRVMENEAKSLYEIIVTDKLDSSNINTYSVSLTYRAQSSNPISTYTNSEFDGVMLPQDNYRIERSDLLSVMYFKDTAPKDCVKATLTIHARVVGDDFNTELGLYSLDGEAEIKYISGKNAPVKIGTAMMKKISAADNTIIKGIKTHLLEYDITSVIPKNGGSFVFALLPVYQDTDYITVASHRNSSYELWPEIKYYTLASQ